MVVGMEEAFDFRNAARTAFLADVVHDLPDLIRVGDDFGQGFLEEAVGQRFLHRRFHEFESTVADGNGGMSHLSLLRNLDQLFFQLVAFLAQRLHLAIQFFQLVVRVHPSPNSRLEIRRCRSGSGGSSSSSSSCRGWSGHVEAMQAKGVQSSKWKNYGCLHAISCFVFHLFFSDAAKGGCGSSTSATGEGGFATATTAAFSTGHAVHAEQTEWHQRLCDSGTSAACAVATMMATTATTCRLNEGQIVRGWSTFHDGCAEKKGKEGQYRKQTDGCLQGYIWNAEKYSVEWVEGRERQRSIGIDQRHQQN